MTKYGVYDTDLQILFDIFGSIDNLKEVWIFGSRARNSFKAKSDFDLCVIRQDKDKTIPTYDLQEKIEESDFWYAVDVKDYHEITNPVFLREIQRDAILIWKDVVEAITVSPQNPYPIGWQEVRLGDVVEEIIDNRGRNPDYYSNYGIPIIDNVLITGQKKVDLTSAKRFIDNPTFEKFIRKYSCESDLLITLVGNGYGNLALMPKEKSVIIQNTIGLRCENKCTNIFIYYFLSHNKKLITDLNIGAAQPSVKVGHLLDIKISLPPLPEQQAIAAILSSLDDKIELLRDQNKTLEELGQKLFQRELAENGDSKSVGMPLVGIQNQGQPRGIAPTNVAENGDSKTVAVKTVVDFIKGVEPGSKNYSEIEKENSVMFYRVSDISNNGQSAKIFVDKDSVKGKTFIFDDILLSLDGTIGKVFVGGNGSYSSGLRKIKIINSEYSNGLIYFWLLLDSTQQTMKLHAQGAVILHAQNSLDYLEIPNNKSFLKLSETFQFLFTKILANTQQIQTLSKTRDTLLPQLMSGKVRV